MTITLRPAQSRFHGQHGWLDSRHTFSFAEFLDPDHMGYRSLRVINDDWIAPGAGFGTHPHRDMEIITYVYEGAVAHKDSSGGEGTTGRGEVQRMTAGHGVRHSEFNASAEQPLRLLQIWILPGARGLEPSYEQGRFDDGAKRDRLCLIASQDGRDGSLSLHQDAAVYASILSPGGSVRHRPAPGRGTWIQMVSGEAEVRAGCADPMSSRSDGRILTAGDGAALDGEEEVTISARREAEFVLFDLA